MADVVVRVDVNERVVRELATGREMQDILMDLADPVVKGAAARAPKRSGRGAASIFAEPVRDFVDGGGDLSVRISWTQERFYMGFQDLGWTQGGEHGGTHFLEQALEQELGR